MIFGAIQTVGMLTNAVFAYSQFKNAEQQRVKILENPQNRTWQTYINCALSYISALSFGLSIVNSIRLSSLNKEWTVLDQRRKDDIRAFYSEIRYADIMMESRLTHPLEKVPHPLERVQILCQFPLNLAQLANMTNLTNTTLKIKKAIDRMKLLQGINSFCLFIHEGLKSRPFMKPNTNIMFIISLSNYLHLFPKSEISKLLAQLDENGQIGLSMLCGYALSEVSKNLQKLPTKADLEKNGFPVLIPLELQQDSILAKRICPMTQLPIRCPLILTTATGTTVYELVAILDWCASCEEHNCPYTDPFSGEPFELYDLRIDKTAKAEIEARLEELRPIWSQLSPASQN